MTDGSEFAGWIKDEQELLWNDLGTAINDAADGAWSMQCGGIARRLVEAARLVGPTPHGAISIGVLAGGVYEAVLRAGGITAEVPDDAEWRTIEDAFRKTAGGLDRDKEMRRFAATCAAIAEERESRYINGGDE